jgi:hypothetical protein
MGATSEKETAYHFGDPRFLVVFVLLIGQAIYYHRILSVLIISQVYNSNLISPLKIRIICQLTILKYSIFFRVK